MTPYLLDTNLLIRILTGEPESQAARAREVLARCESGNLRLRLTVLVVAEVVFVLTGKVYGIARKDLTEVLIPFLQSPSLDVVDRDILIRALELFRDHPIDFVDACLAAEGQLSLVGIASFDADYRKLPGLDLLSF